MIMGPAPVRIQPKPPQAGAFKVRKDLMKGTSLLKRFYDRGDLPICVKHCPQENEISWKVQVDKLDYRECAWALHGRKQAKVYHLHSKCMLKS